MICSVALLFRKPLNNTIITGIISFGIVYGLFMIITVILGFVVALSSFFLDTTSFLYLLISYAIVGLTQYSVIILLFRIKRFSKGLPALQKQKLDDVGVFISMGVLFVATLATMDFSDKNLYLLPVALIFILALTLFFWWRNRITRTYLEKAKANELAALEQIIAARDAEIADLKQSNDTLAKLIHKDNKLIPAMELSVTALLQQADSLDRDAFRERAAGLLEQLHVLHTQRTDILRQSERAAKLLPPSGVASLDGVLLLMLQRAQKQHVTFEVSAKESLRSLVQDEISEQDLNTLVADLLENALIAIDGDVRNLRIAFEKENGIYSLHIFDSGRAFEPQTLQNLGLKRASTHLDSGGSGIGMMTTFELLRKYRASILIDEQPDDPAYTKCVSIYFDAQNEYRVSSRREEVLTAAQTRKELVLV